MKTAKLLVFIAFLTVALIAGSPKNSYKDQILDLADIHHPHNGIGAAKNTTFVLPGITQGAQGAPFKRLATGAQGVSYVDGLQTPVSDRPNPRTVSNIVGQQTSRPVKNSRLGLSILFTFWGQFLDHDLTLGLPPKFGPREVLNIEIPNGDPFFPDGSVIPFQRNNAVPANAGAGIPRQQINTLSAIIDLTQVYGANKTDADAIRSFVGGKLKASDRPQDDNLLPRWSQFGVTGQAGNRFRGGQQRTNQNLALTSLQTLFFREHNRLCDKILALDKRLRPNDPEDDQKIYNIARNYNIALFQKITIKDWLPNVLGRQKWLEFIGNYDQPSASANPTLLNEFSNAAFRIGHTLLTNFFPQIDQNNNVVEVFGLKDMFEGYRFVNSNRMNLMFRCLTKVFAKEKSREIIDDIRNFLFVAPNLDVILDLFALNLQRGREHGLPDYKKMRVLAGVDDVSSPISTFSNITNDEDTQERLDRAYGGDIDKIDPWVGIITEKPYSEDSVFGALGVEIIGRTFRDIRNGHIFWYQHVFGSKVLKEIQQTTLADIIARNTDIDRSDLQDDVFHVSSHSSIQDSIRSHLTQEQSSNSN